MYVELRFNYNIVVFDSFKKQTVKCDRDPPIGERERERTLYLRIRPNNVKRQLVIIIWFGYI